MDNTREELNSMRQLSDATLCQHLKCRGGGGKPVCCNSLERLSLDGAGLLHNLSIWDVLQLDSFVPDPRIEHWLVEDPYMRVNKGFAIQYGRVSRPCLDNPWE